MHLAKKQNLSDPQKNKMTKLLTNFFFKNVQIFPLYLEVILNEDQLCNNFAISGEFSCREKIAQKCMLLNNQMTT